MRCLVFASLWCLARPFTPSLRVVPARVVHRHHCWGDYSSRRVSFFSTTAAASSQGQDEELTTTSTSTSTYENDDKVVELKFGEDQLVTLIGTAHLSKASTDQVTSIIESTRPDVVMVELDVSRLERIGIDDPKNLGLPFTTAEDIVVPLQEDDKLALMNKQPWWIPAQNFLLDTFTQIARKMLTGMYDGMGETMGEGMMGGGEFLAAINAAKKDPACEKIVLGDRDSTVTLRRAFELAVRSGDFWGVLSRLQDANYAEMNELEERIREEYKDQDDEGVVTTAMVEALKNDTEIRSRIFTRLEQEVPEFTRAFMTERDYIMATAIQREITRGAKHVVGVIGLAHVPGMAENLEAMWKNEKN